MTELSEGVVLRPLLPEDEDAYVALRMLWERTFDEDALRGIVRGERFPVAHAVVADRDGELVGGALFSAPPPSGDGAFRGLVQVREDQRRQGIGTRLLADVLAGLGPDAVLMAVVHDDDPGSLAAVTSWGFEQLTHGISSEWRAVPVPEPAVPDGTSLVVHRGWDDLPDDFDAFLDASDTTPEREHSVAVSTAELAQFFPTVLLVRAEVEGRTAAATMATDQGKGRWLVGYTGVHPEYRRRGLGRLVKEHLHARASAEGAQVLATINEATNTAVRSLNAELGYVPCGGEIRVRRRPGD